MPGSSRKRSRMPGPKLAIMGARKKSSGIPRQSRQQEGDQHIAHHLVEIEIVFGPCLQIEGAMLDAQRDERQQRIEAVDQPVDEAHGPQTHSRIEAKDDYAQRYQDHDPDSGTL